MALTLDLMRAMADHARQDRPSECCGALAGPIGSQTATELVRCRNEAADPSRFYEIGADSLIRMYFDLADRGLEPVAWYHSHPSGPPLPSRADIAYMGDPRVRYLILGEVDGDMVATCWHVNPMTGRPYQEDVDILRTGEGA